MKQVFVSNRRGIVVETVATPSVQDKHVLVANAFSLISTGTELRAVESAKSGIAAQIRRPTELAQKVLRKLRDGGVDGLLKHALRPPETFGAVGYSTSGVVLALGRGVTDLNPGDRVACGGAEAAHHAEVVSVPRLLAARLPDAVSLRDAAFTTLGAIAMQGVRRAECNLGETVVIVGLGLLGLLAVQISKAAGLKVIGLDLRPDRVELARTLGADLASTPGAPEVHGQVRALTEGFGADAVLLYAATESSAPVNLAFDLCRQRGRVVVIGAVGMNLERERMYRKELSLVISTSYGPGRNDPTYEEEGIDYPIGYVRWTENRQMQEFLNLLAGNKVTVAPLISEVFPIDRASAAYETLGTEQRALAVLLEYPHTQESRAATIPQSVSAMLSRTTGAVQLGIVGLGSFVVTTRLPDIKSLGDMYHVRAVVSQRAEQGTRIARECSADYVTADSAQLFADDSVEMVMIGNRHHQHAELTLAALRAGKAVFVEKPLCLTMEELREIQAVATETKRPLFVGFNRRYSPFARAIRQVLSMREPPFMLTYRVNVGSVSPDHWTLDPDIGGGRIIGESCHFFDLFLYLFGENKLLSDLVVTPVAVDGRAVTTRDNIVATLRLSDGSVATLIYTLLGNPALPKERAEIFAGNVSFVLDDYRSLSAFGVDPATLPVPGARMKGHRLVLPRQDKGWRQELIEVARALRGQPSEAISASESFRAMEITLQVEALTRNVLAGGMDS